MAEEGKSAPPDAQLFGLLSNLLQQVESLTNQEEVELRSKIEALGLEVTKVPTKSTKDLDELEIAKELDKLSAKLDDVDEMISSAMAADPQVKSLLSSTADVWMPVITATSDERRNFTASSSIGDDNREANGKIAN
ncbi:hypothetical protein ACSBR2_004374 [Camellia fascicularis]|uniref:Uncharacterized protein n=2 Tax=Camellia lanceoleosa TaxID=1840588 RepID=A0ACC0IH07_9ERIC|nr:hypothetical protein LOK49_LG03G02871 [Camellia lanceoleosa]KAI8024180.1 hypothetical protein LOK49_LG03G02869 [Camellia lanceoleosa]